MVSCGSSSPGRTRANRAGVDAETELNQAPRTARTGEATGRASKEGPGLGRSRNEEGGMPTNVHAPGLTKTRFLTWAV